MTGTAKPEFAVNRAGNTVAEALNSFICEPATNRVGGARVDIATAYFNVGGYALLADALGQATCTRLLLGAEPIPPEQRPRPLGKESHLPARAARDRVRNAVAEHETHLLSDRDLLGFDREVDTQTQRLIDWLRSGQVEVRRLEARFLHGKAFLISDGDHGVIAGSSNLTAAGLTTNAELNLGAYQPHTVQQVQQWYEELWDEANEYDLAALFESRFEPHAPYLIFLRMLWERYADELKDEHQNETEIHLTSFQTDGVWRAKRILDRLNGVLIADEVGLGKTFIAGEMIREAALDRRQRVLVITPATLRDGPWRQFMSEYNLPMELVSFEELLGDQRLNPGQTTGTKLDAKDINQYAMVVIDEAHNLRNPSTQRANALRRLLAGSPAKQLVLLTATPVNNSLLDLYYLLSYFLRNDAAFADVGIRSLKEHFDVAMALNPDDLSPEHMFDVLDAVAVRRTRSFVKTYYANDTIRINDTEQRITFPTPRVRQVNYDLDDVVPGLFNRLAHALNPDVDSRNPETLTLARYVPSMYRLDGEEDRKQTHLGGLLRSGLLKRFESSPHAFVQTCRRMADSTNSFLRLLDVGKVAVGQTLVDWIATDTDELDPDEIDDLLDAADDASEYDVPRLRTDAIKDRDLLLSFANEVTAVTRADDPNLEALVNELADIAAQAATEGIGEQDVRNRRKVLIFTYFADTVDWIREHLIQTVQTDPRLACYFERIAWLAGARDQDSRKSVLWGFAPTTTDAPEGQNKDLYDILITTDVLAEGVNLQQARHIVNYDLPWNPMRLAQRHGRIDRIGSAHDEVFLHCIFPDRQLDELLGLEARLRYKIKQASASIGTGEILPNQPGEDREFTETREEIRKLRREEAELFERGGTARSSLSGEEYRQELRKALQDPQVARQIKALPWGAGSGMAAAPGQRPGYAFCIRVGDHARPLFRFVPMEDLDSSDPSLPDETLICLDTARPTNGWNTARSLPEHIVHLAYDAWQVARADVAAKWNFMADKANLEPDIPRALRRAAEIVRTSPPPEENQETIDRAADTLSAPYPERTVRRFRQAMNEASESVQKARNILAVITELGLEPYHPPEPLPQITLDDIHLLTWLVMH